MVMIRNLTLIALGAAALSACNTQPETITANETDPMAAELANAAPVTLPPAIAASKTYRCKDNSLIYIDWYADGSAMVKMKQDETGTQVPAPVEGSKSPLTGDAKSASVGYNGKTCHV